MEKPTSHYFTEDTSLKPNIEKFSFYYKDLKLELCSNSGMFSPGHVDFATSLLIQTVPSLTGSLLDLGCGYGVIGIALGKYYNLAVTLADINGRALECAKSNCKANKFSAEIIKSDCFENITGTFDTVTLNPPVHAGKQVIFEMYKGTYERLNKNGRFYVVIQKKHGAQSTQKMLTELFDNCETIYKKKGFFIFECTKSV